ncbi:hypothetical protein [Natronogracilivirga saccharolytica]|uniref:Cell division protein FtsL n=1 Tax=Natronogracilivirga saccharolytica TaxID=2812953 RepID=A0A8J7SAE8_9BACT|nr:hypothetical protein [Natronogracilivirga saccharolytica]MBP3193403.1 hypothetical protein [Natronogracilivirga saccharolytica]
MIVKSPPRPSPVLRNRPASNTPKTGPLSGSNGKRSSGGSRKKKKLLSPGKLILWSVALGLAGTLYLTHVFQTQNTLQEVQQLRMEHERAQRIHTEARRNYEQMTGPAEIYSRAQSLGMISGGATDPVIVIDN